LSAQPAAEAKPVEERTIQIGSRWCRQPPLKVRKMPPAPSWSSGIGPGAIMASGAIGSGEIFFWPSMTAAYGPGVFWGHNAGAVVQVYQFNEASRWEICTGEGIDQGFERLIPGISIFYLACTMINSAIPGWAALAATSLMWLAGGLKLPMGLAGAGWEGWCWVTIVLCLIFMVPTKVIYTVLKYLCYATCLIMIALCYVVVAAVCPPDAYYDFFTGMWRQIGWIPDPNTPILASTGYGDPIVSTTPAKLGIGFAFFISSVSYAGSSPSACRSNSKRQRDAGIGMGAYCARITGAFGKREDLAPSGYTCDFTDPEDVKNFKAWHTSTCIDTWIIYTLATMLTAWGFSLASNAILRPQHYVPSSLKVAATQAEILRAIWGTTGYQIMLFVAFLVLWTTQLGNFDGEPRNVADMLYYFVKPVRRFSYRALYWFWLCMMILTAAIVTLTGWATPALLIQLNALIAWFQSFPITLKLLWLNRKLPPPVRTPMYNQVLLVLISLFFIWLTVLWLPYQLGLVK